MDLAEMRCHTPEGLKREVAVNVLAYNLVTLLLCDTAEATEQHPRQLSFSHARDTFIHFAAERSTINDLEWLIVHASQFAIKNRPRREEPREIKTRNGKYARLKQPRPSKQAKLIRENKATVP
jgi:putative transposase